MALRHWCLQPLDLHWDLTPFLSLALGPGSIPGHAPYMDYKQLTVFVKLEALFRSFAPPKSVKVIRD